MNRDEIIEQAVQVVHVAIAHRWMTVSSALREDGDYPELLGDIARALADAGLLARPLPSREEIAMSIAARHWDRDSGEVEVWHDLTDSEKENVAENYLTWDSADAVLDLLKGQDR